jgi:hypothetical protein
MKQDNSATAIKLGRPVKANQAVRAGPSKSSRTDVSSKSTRVGTEWQIKKDSPLTANYEGQAILASRTVLS